MALILKKNDVVMPICILRWIGNWNVLKMFISVLFSSHLENLILINGYLTEIL